MSEKLKWAAVGLVVGILLAAMTAFWASRRNAPPAVKTLDAPAVVREIQRLSDLVSVKYTVQKVVGLEEKKVPLGNEKLLLFVQAEVLAGSIWRIWPPAMSSCSAAIKFRSHCRRPRS